MSFHSLVDSLLIDTRGSLRLFLPELMLCGTIVLMLLLRVFALTEKIGALPLALVGSTVGLGFALWDACLVHDGLLPAQEIFTGMLVFDSFTVFFRTILLLFVVLLCLLTWITRVRTREDSPDFYALILGATLGMCLMASANHLLMVFLAVEMASVPSYVLAGVLKGRRQSSEAALKYSVYGAGTAGVMLYGISLLSGVLGSVHLPTMAQRLAAMDIPQLLAQHVGNGEIGIMALGGLMVMVGLAFKLSAVPFHFWCPDVFEGATAEVNAFLSVASKAAAFGLLVRVAVGFGYVPEPMPTAQAPGAATQAAASGVFSVAEPHAQAHEPDREALASSGPLAALEPVRRYMVQLLALLAAVTCTFGNLAAYGQSNIKRMLAYSTIAHAGYMMMPVAAAIAAVGTDFALARESLAALTFYVVLYLFMNLGAFAVVALLRRSVPSEQISDYAGMIYRAPVTVIAFALMLFSLIGLPPLAGFVGKLAIFVVLMKVGGPVMITLLVIAGLNTAISLVYYLRVVKVMTIDPEPEDRGPVDLGLIPAGYVVVIAIPVLVFGILFDGVYRWAASAAAQLFS